MLTTAKLLLRTAPTTLVRRFPAALVARGFSANPTPTDDEYDDKGHLKTDQLEYLNLEIDHAKYGKKSQLRTDHLESLERQMEQTVGVMEENLANLKKTYKSKRDHLETYTQLDPVMWPLLDQAFQQKEHLSQNIIDLKQQIQELRATRSEFAVEAPDGESDGHILEEMTEVEHILEDIGKPKAKQLFKEYAVEAPDGETDAAILEEKAEVEHILQDTGKPKAAPLFKEYAVEAPDGEPDAAILEEKAEVEHIFQDMGKPKAAPLFKEYAVEAPDGEPDAAILEEKAEVEHIFQDIGKPKAKTPPLGTEFAVDGPDGESDAQLLCDEIDANRQIDEISKTEDTAKINKIHATQTRIHQERARDPEHDW